MTHIDLTRGPDGTFRHTGTTSTIDTPSMDDDVSFNRYVAALIAAVLFGGFVFLIVMLELQIWFGRGVAIFAFIPMLIFFTAVMFSPIPLGLMGILGASVTRDSLLRGAMHGILTWIRTVWVGGLAIITFCLGILAVWSFEDNRLGFYSVLGGTIAITVFFFTLKNFGMWQYRWAKVLFVSLIIGLIVWFTWAQIIPSGLTSLVASKITAIDRAAGRNAVEINICSQSPNDVICRSYNDGGQGVITPERRAWKRQDLTLLPDKWREIRIPRGYGSCYDDIDKVKFRDDSDAAVNFVRSTTEEVAMVDFYLRPQGASSCTMPTN
jgi:hypothetical protein